MGPKSGPLTLVVSQDPMYVTFPVSQVDVFEAYKQGHADIKNIKVKLRFSDESMYDQVGEINFVDVTVDRSTDSVTLRATIPNPKGLLIDNQLVRVIFESGAPVEKTVISQAALIADQEGVYVCVGCADDTRGRCVSDSGRLGIVQRERYGWNSATLVDATASNRQRKARLEATRK